ncbi:hypothetical protein AgCh_013921 [Apium graveolens]
MAPKDLIIDGAKFVPNNYAVVLDHTEAPSELHFVQDLLAHSEVGALHLPEDCTFSIPEDSALRELMAELGYEKSLTKLGQLKRANIIREWSFFFDCITKAFGNKCSNFDAIPIMSQHIGYAIINQTHFDFATALIGFIGDRMTEDRDVVYFARFCQLIYTYCTDEPHLVSTQTPPFKILVNADPDTYRSVYSDVQPTPNTQNPSTLVPTSHSTQPTLRTYLKSYLSTSQTAQPSSSAPTVKSSSSKPKRTKNVPQTPQKRRRITLRDESDSEEPVPAREPVVEVQCPANVPATPAPTSVYIPPQVDYTTPIPFHRSMTFQPIPLKMDSIEDLAEDAAKRGGPEQRGDMTRPLKNWKPVTTLRPEYWVEDDVLNAYGELLRLREDKLWEKWEKIPRTESFKPRRYFIAPSFFMAMALEHCHNLKASPSTLKGDAKKSMEKFFRDYANRGDDKDTTGNIAHPCQYYIMEKLIPCMLNYLHPSRFPLKYMGVHGLDARPKQDSGNDCGVYVSKYMDAMLNGISLPSAVWNAKVDVQTFRYRMAHELSKGVARHISEWGIR